ncbi:MAG: FecR domain-containing protein [Deltaproteobacteria bacterium]|nr:FecR domain-containing protein [Deltaproteobacteria bacterium]
MKAITILVTVTILILGGSVACLAALDYVGIVKTIAGEVVIVRNAQTIKAEANTKLLKGDLVRTGPNGKVGLIFEDDTVVSMGSNSKIMIEQFLFQPAEKKLSFIARIFQGTASFLSGQLAKLAPNLVYIETPQATIGMRGTHLLVKVD